jgi:hypothetical protein
LGAGASKPLGFPTGLELSDIVSRQFQKGQQIFNKLGVLGYSETVMADFREAFYKSGRNSVDAFLEYREDLLEIGKLAIAATLIPKEDEQDLFTYEDSWLRLLYNNMNASFEDFGKNTLSIITYNYDRSVEHFFMTSLQNSYRREIKDCLPVLNAIPIIHLHGSLGPLPWQEPDGPNRPYHFMYNNDLLDVARQHIKIIHEDIDDVRDDDFNRAIKLLNEAEQILFLGFGYNKLNLERLKIKDINSTGKTIIGTALGLGRSEQNEIRKNSDNKINLYGDDCYTLISEQMQWRD